MQEIIGCGKLNSAQKNEIKRLYLRRFTVGELSKIFSISTQLVSYHIKDVRSLPRQGEKVLSKDRTIYEPDMSLKFNHKINKLGEPQAKTYKEYVEEDRIRNLKQS